MLRLNKYFILIILLCFTSSFPQIISSIKIQGNISFSKNDVSTWSGLSAGIKIINGIEDSVKFRLAKQLADRGYLHASFEGTHYEISDDTSKCDFIININQGQPTYYRLVQINGLDSVQSKIIYPLFSFLKGGIFNKFVLEEDVQQSLTYFENNGYPFAKVSVSSIYFYTDSAAGENYADVYLDIIPGIKSKIDHFEISGNVKTKSNVIIRELRVNEGELYSQKVIDYIPGTLNKLGFFEPVGQPEFFLNSRDEGILRINVKERETNNFDGVIGYIPSTGQNQSGYLTGLVNVGLRNIFGTGRAASINWQKYDRFSQLLELKYLEPWLFGYPFNVYGDLFQRKQDSTYVQRKLEGTVEYLATETISASVSIASEQVIPAQSDSLVFTVFNSSSITTGLNLKIDTRDDPFAPAEGILFLNSYSFSSKKIRGPAQFINPSVQTKVSLQRLTFDLSVFYQILQRQIIAASIHGRELRGSSFEISDLFRLGGANSLRGYRENQFLGNRIFWTNTEYRVLLTRRTFGFLFFDTGYFMRNADPVLNVQKSEGFNIGYGVGINLETGLGVLRVSFALAKGDSFSDAKIHFGIVNEF